MNTYKIWILKCNWVVRFLLNRTFSITCLYLNHLTIKNMHWIVFGCNLHVILIYIYIHVKGSMYSKITSEVYIWFSEIWDDTDNFNIVRIRANLERQYTMPHFPENCSFISLVISAVSVDGFFGSTRNFRFGRLKLWTKLT